MFDLGSPIESLGGIGEKVLEKLRKLKIKKVRDLLFYLPFRYEDFSNIKNIADLAVGEKATVTAKILNINNKRTWKRHMIITEALLEDATAPIREVWFHQPYLLQTLIKALWDNAGDMPDFLPNFIAKDFELIKLTRALRQIHFPKNSAETQEAKKRLAFQDIFLLQLYAQSEKQKIKSRPAAGVPINVDLIKKFTGSLPFRLTDSQKIASWQILKDMEKPSPMNRLLVGDVGSGKTVVAVLAALNTALQGYQTAFLAPTEILALQHYKTASQLFAGFNLKVGLLT